ncbi:molecular chaperone HtpG [Acidaminobacter sp. JC074]|uniref:molecular chaperone HtpG n=1 Tax=Acidaminobacter sp. JC074 TaxID=2530199 RepID=UPI001F0F0F2E|nr:molecular chaperone HtpG [Acidaminobacter sp. JC074]MCH4888291.1 molecular chaperone HtpG [Acidaminobacter sp. JC074]
MEKGNLSIHSENIFPIIKKWLYSDHDIFIRELISNASDAITKYKSLVSLGEIKSDETEYKIDVVLNQGEKTLTFIDNGIGMTADEIKQYINQIAFSGAEDFIEKYKDKADQDQIIGHFGLGFYSAFMVAEKVEINTLSYQEGATSAKWHCDGGTEFELEEGTRKTRGTEIKLFLGEDGVDFENEFTVKRTIEKYCSFMPYEIFFTVEDKEAQKDEEGNDIVEEIVALNDTTPLYAKKPSECTDEEYKAFYSKTFMDFKEPLFWIHLNMDYPFNLKGILYFPKLGTNFDTLEGQIKLYNNQVFVADNLKEVIPEFLMLLKGVIDCPDLPLNVSRSMLQNDGFVKKISDYISKKVADKLTGLFKTERDAYEKYWDDIQPFIKYGAIKEKKFNDKVKDVLLFKLTDDQYVTAEEYLQRHEGKLDKEIYYTTDTLQQTQYIQNLQEHGVEVAILDHPIDSAFISHMEAAAEDVKYKRVDSGISDMLKEEDDTDHKDVEEKLVELFKKSTGQESIKIKIESLKNEDLAGMIILTEESRRMQDMMKQYGGMGMDASMFPSDETLVLNKKNPLVSYTIDHLEGDEETLNLVTEQIYDLAVLSHRPLTAEGMTKFVKRSNDILKRAIIK